MYHVRWYTETKTTPQVGYCEKNDPSHQAPLVWALICINVFPSWERGIRICLAQSISFSIHCFKHKSLKAVLCRYEDVLKTWSKGEILVLRLLFEFMWNRMWGLIFNHRLTQNTTHFSCSKGDLWEGTRLHSLFTICLFL